MRLTQLITLLVVTSTATAAPRVEVIQSFSLDLTDTIAFMNLNGSPFGEGPYGPAISISDDGRRLLVPVPNGETGSSFEAPLRLYDRSIRSIIDILVQSDDGIPTPPLAIDVLSSSGNWLAGRNIDGSLFRWNQSTGSELLRDQAGNPFRGQAVAISRDGSRIVGNIGPKGKGFGFEYSDSVGTTKLFTIDQLNPGITLLSDQIRIGAMSDDGSTLVVHVQGPLETLLAPGIWNVFQGLPPQISSDGSVIVNFDRPTRILQGGTWKTLADPLVPLGISADGSTIVGFNFLSGFSNSLILDTYPYFAVEGNGGTLLDLTTFIPGVGPVSSIFPSGTFYDVTLNRQTYYAVLVTESVGPSSYSSNYHFVTISVPEVSAFGLVGLMTTVAVIVLIYRRWQYSNYAFFATAAAAFSGASGEAGSYHSLLKAIGCLARIETFADSAITASASATLPEQRT